MISYFAEETFLPLHFISSMKLRNLKDSHHNSKLDLTTAMITNMTKLTSQYAFNRRISLRRITLQTVTNSLSQLTQEGELDAGNLIGCTESGELCHRYRKANLFCISIGHCIDVTTTAATGLCRRSTHLNKVSLASGGFAYVGLTWGQAVFIFCPSCHGDRKNRNVCNIY